jgi:membrane protease YdiL (CAAX protease family)
VGGRVTVARATINRDTDDWLTAIVSAIGIAIVAYAVGNVIALLMISLLRSAGIAVADYPGRAALVSAIALQAIGFGGVALMYVEFTERGHELVRVHVPTLREVGYFIGGIVAVFLGLIAATSLIRLIGIQPAESAIITGIRDPTLLLVLIPVSIVIVGPAEELLFRGLVQGRIKRAIGPVGAIVIASAVFASIHTFGLLGSPWQMIATLSVIFVLALILGSLYELTGNIVIPAIVHGLYNAIQFYLAYLQAVGGVPGTG